MEEFDRHLKSKVESLTEVPGVKFDEKRVWRSVKSGWNGGSSLLIGVVLLFLSAIMYIHPQDEDLVKHTEFPVSKEIVAEVSADSNIVESTSVTPLAIYQLQKEDSIDSVKFSLSNQLEDSVYAATSMQRSSRLVHTKNDPPVERTSGKLQGRKKEISITLSKENQSIGVTHLRRLGNHLSLSYGVHFNNSWNRNFNRRESIIKPVNIHQIQFPVGLRYEFINRERRFNPFLYAGLKQSVLFQPNTKSIDYHLTFESELGLDYRIFSTRNGKNGYLRFKLPLYNKGIINQGMYQPSLYDVLKQ